jgi:hypothetical protein
MKVLALSARAGYFHRMNRRATNRVDPVNTLVAQSLKGLARWAKQPPAVRFRAMVKSGLIDEGGKVRNKPSPRTLGDLTRELETRRRQGRATNARIR